MLNTDVSAIAAEAEECRQDAIDFEALYQRRGATILRLRRQITDLQLHVSTLLDERNILARKCAELAHQNADLISPPKPGTPRATIFQAIATMQRGGVR
jgi:hypothetical protein